MPEAASHNTMGCEPKLKRAGGVCPPAKCRIKNSYGTVPFGDEEFDLAVCSHLLFLYSEQLSKDFHVASIRELCRVAGEVRIFPLLELGANTSRHLQAVTSDLNAEGYTVTITPVPYEFQRGGNQMMKVGAYQNSSP